MDAVTTVPPTSIFTCAVVVPLVTSTIFPLSVLRALIFMSSLHFFRGCRCQQGIKLRLAKTDLVEELVELPCGGAQIFRELSRIKDRQQPAHANEPLDPRGCVKPSKR